MAGMLSSNASLMMQLMSDTNVAVCLLVSEEDILDILFKLTPATADSM